ncbi:MAG: hypothetical protein CMP75_04050 [Flavobacteriales bacterium]|nr:hypothetical protein [Flavobacteriales bacterium]
MVLLSLTAVTYAAFPVQTEGTNQTTIVTQEDSSSNANTPFARGVDWGLAVICWLVGYLGIHRFMLGDKKNGILMLLTLGGCGIWALIDLINILSGKMSRF